MMARSLFSHSTLVNLLTLIALALAGPLPSRADDSGSGIKDRVLESFPNRLQSRLEQRIRTLHGLTSPHAGMSPHFIINLTKRWTVGKTITVAFRGGDAALHKNIADTVVEWTKYANLTLDFKDPATGNFRTWKTTDQNFAADVRVSFDQVGYYSLVGTDSINPQITRANEESLNLGGFDAQLPSDWKGVALHEFGHAIGFEHEHQNPIGNCDFRFDDDPGYVPTTDQFGQYTPDPEGRSPGLYTYLGGPPNNWPKAVVDFNLRSLPNSSAYETGPFDKDSIMKYFFPAWMFVGGMNSQCYTDSENLVLSAGDKAGAAKVYPKTAAAITAAASLQKEAITAITNTPNISAAVKKHFQERLEMLKE